MAKLIEITGKALSGEWGSDDEAGTGIPVLRTTNFTNDGIVDYSNVVTRTIKKKNLEEKFLRKGDILIEKSGGSDKQPVGRVIYFDGPGNTYLFNNFTGLLRVKDQNKWFPRYVFYSLFSNYRSGGTRAYENKTTGLHNLKIDDYVVRYEVAEVDITHQITVCEQLDKVSAVVSMHQQELQKLDELVKARFVEMFGTYPANEKGWETGTIRDLVSEVRYGSSRKAADGDTGQYPYLRMNNITYSGELDLSDTKTIDIPDEELPKCTVRRGDVLFNRTNSKELVGKTCVYNRDEMMVLAGFIVRVRVNDRILPEILSAFLNTDFSKQMLLAMCKAAIGQANINAQELQNIGIYIPPLEQQKEFVAFKDQVDKSKFVVQQALDKAQTLFDSLMQKYFG